MAADEDLKLADLLKYYLRESQAAKVTVSLLSCVSPIYVSCLWTILISMAKTDIAEYPSAGEGALEKYGSVCYSPDVTRSSRGS